VHDDDSPHGGIKIIENHMGIAFIQQVQTPLVQEQK